MFRRNRPQSGLRGPQTAPVDQPSAAAEPAPLPQVDGVGADDLGIDKGIEMQSKPPTPSAPLPGQGPIQGLVPGQGAPSAPPPVGAPAGAPAFRNDIPRRVVEVPGAPPRRVPPTGTEGNPPAPAELRKLIVGRDISLSGEIGACDVLVVEGTVEAKLREGHTIEVAETGLFRGSVEIDEADIGGRFEGDITVRGLLKVRGTGVIKGNIRYGVLEVEQGGLLVGTIETLDTAAAKPVSTVEPAVEI